MSGNGGGCVTGWCGGYVTAHQQPHWFLWLSGFSRKTEPPCLPPTLLQRPAPSAGKLGESLFSRMGSENSLLFVLAAVPFPAEGAWCPDDRGQGLTGATWSGVEEDSV